MDDKKTDKSTLVNGVTRREFLKKAGMLSALAGAPSILKGASGLPNNASDVKNVIFMVSDGMSHGTLTLADLVKKRQFGMESNWLSIYESDRKFRRCYMDTASLNSSVTDSAAASSAWATGYRTNNGALCMGPDGEKYQPILDIFKKAGRKTGLVTTTRITHATPAGFAVNIPVRYMEDEIAVQYLERGYDLLMGGGARHFESSNRSDKRDLFNDFRQAGYQVVKNKSGLNNLVKQKKMIGIFSESHFPYSIDYDNTDNADDSVPTLNEMVRVALNRLSSTGDGFILQIEGGRVDHGGHDNDPAGLVYDQIMFDKTIGTVLNFVDNRNDTLLIITTDHGTANPGLNGMGSRYTESDDKLEQLFRFKKSNTWILDQIDSDSSIGKIQDAVEAATAIGITGKEAGMLKKSLNGNFETPYRMERTPDAVLGALQANYIGINWMGTVHTSDYVELALVGAGIDRVDHFVRNTELFDLMVETAGVREYVENSSR